MSLLKPCPFCAGEAMMLRIHGTCEDGSLSALGPVFWDVSCMDPDCLLSPNTGSRDDKDEAITAWNTRPAPKPMVMGGGQ